MTTTNLKERVQPSQIDDPEIAQVMQIIEERACEGLRIKDILEATGLPRRTLERKFQKLANSSLHYEILSRQAARARHLLRTTHLKLADVAEQSGFKTVAHLCVTMQRHFQKTPNEIRKESEPHYNYVKRIS
ncbi:MAG: AraC family transcriptional regulator [Planctomycetia bacterium]|nr:AraC family transcriptional regulator [Planctomycetia bacterium]